MGGYKKAYSHMAGWFKRFVNPESSHTHPDNLIHHLKKNQEVHGEIMSLNCWMPHFQWFQWFKSMDLDLLFCGAMMTKGFAVPSRRFSGHGSGLLFILHPLVIIPPRPKAQLVPPMVLLRDAVGCRERGRLAVLAHHGAAPDGVALLGQVARLQGPGRWPGQGTKDGKTGRLLVGTKWWCLLGKKSDSKCQKLWFDMI